VRKTFEGSLPVEGQLLIELLLVIAIAAAGVALFERLGLPAIAGFLVMGALMGPGGFGLVDDPERVRGLAELGVVFLLFEIGLELPIERVRRLWRTAAAAGALQVGVTLLAVAAVARLLGVDWPAAIMIGALVAISSTALVLGLLTERGEVDAPQGQLSVGILLFQDLCIVPLLLAVPILAGAAEGSGVAVLWATGRALLALGALFILARFLVPFLLERVARLRSRDLFSLLALLLVLGSAVLAQGLGLTLAVGAFIGGLVASASPYAYQLFSEVVPLRGVLLGLFFTAVGMLLDPAAALGQAPEIALYVTAVVFGKAIIVAFIVGVVLRRSPRVALQTGMGLAQTGEFSFVLAAAAVGAGLLPEGFAQVFVAGSVLTLIATPFLMRAAPALARVVGDVRDRDADVDMGELPEEAPHDHAVLIGYGTAGRNVARVLRAVGFSFAAVDTNPHSINDARGRGEPVFYGDATRAPMLRRLGVERARFVVVAINDPVATGEITTLVRRLAPEVRILVKARYLLEIDALSGAGADVVVSEELEATVDLVAEVLRLCGIGEGPITRFARELREEGYQALRAPPAQAIDPWLAEVLREVPTDWVEVPDDFVGESTLELLGVRARTGANVLAVERDGVPHPGPPPAFALRAGDRLLVFGSPEAADRLRRLLESGSVDREEG
jgi:CPA2 family monovalent cation:H+ antiporter-2